MEKLSIEQIKAKRLRGDATAVAKALKTDRWRVMAALDNPKATNHNQVICCFSRLITARESAIKQAVKDVRKHVAYFHQICNTGGIVPKIKRKALLNIMEQHADDLRSSIQILRRLNTGIYKHEPQL